KNQARAFYNLNYQTILRLRSKSQQQKWVKQNKVIYESILKTIKLIPASSTQCTVNECCFDEKINVKAKNELLSLIDRQYKLYKSIRKIIPGWGSPGVPCTRSKAECERDKRKYQDLLRWVDKRAKQIRSNELIQTKDIPLVDTECRNIYAV
ncbi:MAG: hypothetical protein GYA55_01880, partial [SAR324 cluster bacterium]|nr:hypothetical protein [SAR324 cluster bacterium]